jgi:hypothetical protein
MGWPLGATYLFSCIESLPFSTFGEMQQNGNGNVPVGLNYTQYIQAEKLLPFQ